MAHHEGIGDKARVGGHETVHVGPYLQHSGAQRRGDEGSRVVAAAASQVRNLAGVAVGGDEAACYRAAESAVAQCLFYKSVGERRIGYVFVEPPLGAYEVGGMVIGSVFDNLGNEGRRHPFAEAHHLRQRAVGEVAQQGYPFVEARKLGEQLLYAGRYILAARGGHECFDDFKMPAPRGLNLPVVFRVAVAGHFGACYQAVRKPSQGRHHHHAGFLDALDYLLDIAQRAHCPYRRAPEFQYSHLNISVIFSSSTLRCEPSAIFLTVATPSFSSSLPMMATYGTFLALAYCICFFILALSG